MPTIHKTITLKSFPRGFHLISDLLITPMEPLVENGLLHFFIQHTSAGLTINENADSSVRRDFEKYINHIVPEEFAGLEHTFEGIDDMPAHVKASIFGSAVSIPVINRKPALGRWQGIYLCEFRNHAPSRSIIGTLYS